MKIKEFLIVIMPVLIIDTFASAQAPDTIWTRAYGGIEADGVNSFIETGNGAFLIAGFTGSFGQNGDIYFIKINSHGEWFFENHYGGLGSENAESVTEATDGGYIISGHSRFYGENDNNIFLGKTDSDGNMIWSQVYVQPGSDEYGCSVLETADQDIVIAGYVTHYDPFNKNLLLMKTNDHGDPIWTLEFGTTGGEDVGQSVIGTADGGYVTAGWTTSNGHGSGDVYLLKTNSDGEQRWYRTYGFTGWEEGLYVTETSDGGFAIIGRTNSVGNGWWDIYLVKTDSSGIMEWWQTYGGEDGDGGNSVIETPDGGYLLGCYTDSFGPGIENYYLIRTDSLGNEIWHKTIGGSSADYGQKALYSSDGDIYFIGSSWSFGHGSMDIYLVKLEGELTAVSDQAVPNPGSIQLLQNFPNPFNASTNIRFGLSEKSDVLVEIFNILGQKAATLFEGDLNSGQHTITWEAGSEPSGIYFYRIRAGEYMQARRMILLK